VNHALNVASFAPRSRGDKPRGFRSPPGLASFLLIATLLVPTSFALWAAVASYRSGVASRLASQVPDLLASARVSLVLEESLTQKYRLAPSADTRLRHQKEAAILVGALQRASVLSPPDQAQEISALLTAHQRYFIATGEMFAAVDAGDTATAASIDAREQRLEFGELNQAVLAAVHGSLAGEAVYDNRRDNIELGVLIGTPILFVVNLALALLLLLIKRVNARRAQAAAMHEAEAIRRSEQRFRALVQNASDVVIISDVAGTITYQSPAAATVWGYAEKALMGQPTQTLVHPDDQAALQDLWQQLQDAPGTTRSTELRVRRHDGMWRHVELILTNLSHEVSVEGFVLTWRDIEERKAFEQQLTQRAFHDPLTGLPNRLLFHDRIEQALARASRRRCLVGLLYMDLDNFKLINDSLGHGVGDQLLVQVAGRLLACGRAEDTVARLGGDEFVVLLDCVAGEADAGTVAENIARQFKRPFALEGRDVVVSVSIGVALGDASQDKAETLLRNADVAMYRAKSNGNGRFVVFDASMQTDALARLELENDLRRALNSNELRVYYQPIVRMQSRRLVEVEALVRWQHPTRGLIAPAEFIPMAEETGLIVPLGYWVLEQACRQAAEWQALSPLEPLLVLSVNLSPRQFQQPDLDKEIIAILQRTGLVPSTLKLEITEGVIMEDVDRTITMLGKLKDIGVKLAIDDFGTGYSSLAYLKRLPLDVLKIDRSFVNGIGQNQEDTAIVRAILSLAKSLNLSVTGEGIETADQADLLNTMGCDHGQGYFFARPLVADGVTAMLEVDGQSQPGLDEAPRKLEVEVAVME
jgi:diguanylate cyclase (GGDEF)-like protein/PAS domain S-box-containing protein